ncbi:hypothetical protein COOONC_00305 [Cooperia oncophora]
MATRFIYTDRYYKELAVSRKITICEKEWDYQAEGMLLQLDKNMRRFTSLLQEMEKEWTQAEKDLNVGPCQTNAEHINRLFRKAFDNLKSSDRDDAEKRFEELQKKITEQAAEISLLKEQIQKPQPHLKPRPTDVEMTDDAYWSRMVEEVHDMQEISQPQTPPPLASDGDDEDEQMEYQPTAEADNDERRAEEPLEVYEDRVVERVPRQKSSSSEDQEERGARNRASSPENEPLPLSTGTPADSYPLGEHAKLYRRRNADELRRLIEDVKNDIEKMESMLLTFPYRKKEHFSPGIRSMVRCAFCDVTGEYFSVSCPNITEGSDRWNITQDRFVCQHCLTHCRNRNRCSYRRKSCFYYDRVRGTPFESLIPTDTGHHTDLCDVPDKRGDARLLIEEARQELRDLLGELAAVTMERQRD